MAASMAAPLGTPHSSLAANIPCMANLHIRQPIMVAATWQCYAISHHPIEHYARSNSIPAAKDRCVVLLALRQISMAAYHPSQLPRLPSHRIRGTQIQNVNRGRNHAQTNTTMSQPPPHPNQPIGFAALKLHCSGWHPRSSCEVLTLIAWFDRTFICARALFSQDN